MIFRKMTFRFAIAKGKAYKETATESKVYLVYFQPW